MHRMWTVTAVAVGVVCPLAAYALTYDVQIQRSDVTFQPPAFFVGDLIRVYATVKNIGEREVQGNVFFSENGTAIGTPPPFSVKARGAEEEVWVDWQPATVGERQIFVRVVTAPETRDGDLLNNEMIVPVVVDRDSDRDGVGDREDPDDDGDGLPDEWETAHGLNPLDPGDALRDPDGDGRSTIDEYRAGTDPFKKQEPGVGSQPAPIGASGGSGGTGAGSAPASAGQTTTPPASAPVRPSPSAPSVPNIAPAAQPSIAETARRSTAAGTTTRSGDVRPAAPAAPAMAPGAPPVRPPSPVVPYDAQLSELLGRPASPWRSVLPLAAGGIAVAAAAAMVTLRLRRRSIPHDALRRGTTEGLDRRPPRSP